MIIVINRNGKQFQATTEGGQYRSGGILTLDGVDHRLDELVPGGPVKLVPKDDPDYIPGVGTRAHTVINDRGGVLQITSQGGKFNSTMVGNNSTFNFGGTMTINVFD